MHGGTITAESAGVGAGSRFTLRLPIGSSYQEPSVGADDPNKAFVSASPTRVLIVEDNVDIASSFDLVLTEFGYSTKTAHTGEQGLEIAEQFQPEAVLVDIGLPGINGFEVAQRLRKSTSLPAPVIIAMSGYGLDTLSDKSAHLVFRHYLLKPVDPLKVAELIAAELKHAAS